MAYVIANRRGEFEIRESRSTPEGPRSRTLATFRELDADAIERARAKASKPLDPDALRRDARRAGATVASTPADRAARELIAELGKGNPLDSGLRRMLVDLLAEDAPPRSAGDASHSVAEWMAATPGERGSALVDLLLLADALPHSGRVGTPLEYPPLNSGGR